MDEQDAARQYILALVRAGVNRGERDRFDAFGYLLARIRHETAIEFRSNLVGLHAPALWDALDVLVMLGDLRHTVSSSGGETITTWKLGSLPPGHRPITVDPELIIAARELVAAASRVRARSTRSIAVAAKLVYAADHMPLPADLVKFSEEFRWRLEAGDAEAGVALARILGLLPKGA